MRSTWLLKALFKLVSKPFKMLFLGAVGKVIGGFAKGLAKGVSEAKSGGTAKDGGKKSFFGRALGVITAPIKGVVNEFFGSGSSVEVSSQGVTANVSPELQKKLVQKGLTTTSNNQSGFGVRYQQPAWLWPAIGGGVALIVGLLFALILRK